MLFDGGMTQGKGCGRAAPQAGEADSAAFAVQARPLPLRLASITSKTPMTSSTRCALPCALKSRPWYPDLQRRRARRQHRVRTGKQGRERPHRRPLQRVRRQVRWGL